MKNTDIAMVILIAAVSVVLSYFLGNAILGDPNDRVESIEYMDRISGSIDKPDAETFNAKAKNPTVEVFVGNCGPLEIWNENERVCKLRPEFGGDAEEKKEEENNDDNNNLDNDDLNDEAEDYDNPSGQSGGR